MIVHLSQVVLDIRVNADHRGRDQHQKAHDYAYDHFLFRTPFIPAIFPSPVIMSVMASSGSAAMAAVPVPAAVSRTVSISTGPGAAAGTASRLRQGNKLVV